MILTIYGFNWWSSGEEKFTRVVKKLMRGLERGVKTFFIFLLFFLCLDSHPGVFVLYLECSLLHASRIE